MKRTLFCLLFLAFLSLSGKAREEKVIYERYCEAVKEKATFPTGDLMVETARFFLGDSLCGWDIRGRTRKPGNKLAWLGLHDFG